MITGQENHKTPRRDVIAAWTPSVTAAELEKLLDTAVWVAAQPQRGQALVQEFEATLSELQGGGTVRSTATVRGAMELAIRTAQLGTGDRVLVPRDLSAGWLESLESFGLAPIPMPWTPSGPDLEALRTLGEKEAEGLLFVPTPESTQTACVDLAKQKGWSVIEDRSQVIEHRPTSSNHVVFFSFGESLLWLGAQTGSVGGAVLSTDPSVAAQQGGLSDTPSDLSPLQAALGIAQLRRFPELVANQQQIQSLYLEHLGAIPGLKLHPHLPSLLPAESLAEAGLETVRTELKRRFIDTTEVPTGLRLPTGAHLVEDDIAFIAAELADVLGKKVSRKMEGPWAKLRSAKNEAAALELPFSTLDGKPARLRILNYGTLEDPAAVERLAKWRMEKIQWFPAQFQVTVEGTKRWLQHALLDTKDRVSFWVLDSTGKEVGHVGLFRITPQGDCCEIDNILRGENTPDKGIMYSAIKALLKWQREFLQIPGTRLRVFSDNVPAIALYERLGYREIQRTPLKSLQTADRTEWREIVSEPYLKADRYYVTMAPV